MSNKFVRFIHKFCDFVLVAAICVSVYFCPQWYKKQWHSIQSMYVISQGDKLLKKGEYQKAIDKYHEAFEIYPAHYGAWFNLGNLYVAYEDFYSAIDAYAHAITLNPDYVLARMNYGIISTEKLGNFDSAIEQYDKILEIRKKPAYIFFVLGNLKSYKKNIGLTYYNRGVAYHGKYMYSDNSQENKQIFLSKAIESFKKALEIIPNDYDATYNLALDYQINGDYNLAGLSYCKAIAIDPMNYESHYNLALLLNHLKYYKEALVEIHRANTLLDSKNSSVSQTKYLFDVMSLFTRESLKTNSQSRYPDDNQETQTAQDNPEYVNRSSVNTDDYEREMYEKFKVCAGKNLFRDEENWDETDYKKHSEDVEKSDKSESDKK